MQKIREKAARKNAGLLFLLLLVACPSSSVHAADAHTRTRSGFSPSMAFSLSTGVSSLSEETRAAGGSMGLGIDFALGGFATDNISIHWSGHSHYLFSEGSAIVVGLGGPRVTYYMERKSPGWHFSATVGVSNSTILSDSSRTSTGVGASFTVGYEFKPHHSVELELFAGMADPGRAYDDSDAGGSLVLICASIASSGYLEGP